MQLRIKEIRKRRGMSQKKLGQLVGVSGETIMNWENGIYEPKLDNIVALANVFHVSIDYLFGYHTPNAGDQFIEVLNIIHDYPALQNIIKDYINRQQKKQQNEK